MRHADAEGNSRPCGRIGLIGFHYQAVPSGYGDSLLQVLLMVEAAVELDVPEIDIRVDAKAPDIAQDPALDCGFHVHTVCRLLENFQRVAPVGPLRRPG